MRTNQKERRWVIRSFQYSTCELELKCNLSSVSVPHKLAYIERTVTSTGIWTQLELIFLPSPSDEQTLNTLHSLCTNRKQVSAVSFTQAGYLDLAALEHNAVHILIACKYSYTCKQNKSLKSSLPSLYTDLELIIISAFSYNTTPKSKQITISELGWRLSTAGWEHCFRRTNGNHFRFAGQTVSIRDNSWYFCYVKGAMIMHKEMDVECVSIKIYLEK